MLQHSGKHIIVDQNASKRSFEKRSATILRKYKENEFKVKHTDNETV